MFFSDRICALGLPCTFSVRAKTAGIITALLRIQTPKSVWSAAEPRLEVQTVFAKIHCVVGWRVYSFVFIVENDADLCLMSNRSIFLVFIDHTGFNRA